MLGAGCCGTERAEDEAQSARSRPLTRQAADAVTASMVCYREPTPLPCQIVFCINMSEHRAMETSPDVPSAVLSQWRQTSCPGSGLYRVQSSFAQAYAAGVKVRDKRAKEAAGSKKGWQSRIAAIAGEEAALKREVDELAGALLRCGTAGGRPAI